VEERQVNFLKLITEKAAGRPKNQRVVTVAVVSKGGSVYSVGFNDYARTCFRHKDGNGYSDHSGIHAEIAAILSCHRKQLKGSLMTIFAATLHGNPLKCSKPCPACMNAIRFCGVKKIRYLEDGVFKTEKV
jgi:tRNA(Arg) A34 adenosine deaminase TadA